LTAYGATTARPDLVFAGQLTGVEGYTESSASGILAGINLDRIIRGCAPALPPSTTMLGALYRYLSDANPAAFQPMNSNFGLLDPLADPPRDKGTRRVRLVARAHEALNEWLRVEHIDPVAAPLPQAEHASVAAAECAVV
ncbi:MAG: FAD-dependent oxidoreductase, partial [Longimicrobiales bacterium]